MRAGKTVEQSRSNGLARRIYSDIQRTFPSCLAECFIKVAGSGGAAGVDGMADVEGPLNIGSGGNCRVLNS